MVEIYLHIIIANEQDIKMIYTCNYIIISYDIIWYHQVCVAIVTNTLHL